ncbi:MAG TPA: hypothetical protein VIN08_07490 [Ohtaekwangia sp.]|uniref:hypothetical protein n=1 Tax=Ohtaekwangia sp. TaxID=2066019 RepID=UPI002F94C415
MRNLEKFFFENQIELNGNVENVIELLKKDNYLFKQFLRMVIYERIKFHIPEIDYFVPIERLFPRKYRYGIVRDLEDKTSLSFPKMILSKNRMRLLLLCIFLPLCLVTFLVLTDLAFLVVPMSALGIVFYIFIIAIPYIAISVISPSFFMPYDWTNINTINDLISDMVIDNYSKFMENNFSLIREELEKSQL